MSVSQPVLAVERQPRIRNRALRRFLAKRSALGIPELIRRAEAEAVGLDPGFVAAGFSMGAAVAQYIAGTTPGARAAVLVSGAAAPDESGVERCPEGVAVQVHYAEHDPWVDAEDVAALGESVRSAGAVFQAHIYAGSGHLFTDPDLPEYDPASAGALQDRTLAFIRQL